MKNSDAINIEQRTVFDFKNVQISKLPQNKNSLFSSVNYDVLSTISHSSPSNDSPPIPSYHSPGSDGYNNSSYSLSNIDTQSLFNEPSQIFSENVSLAAPPTPVKKEFSKRLSYINKDVSN